MSFHSKVSYSGKVWCRAGKSLKCSAFGSSLDVKYPQSNVHKIPQNWLMLKYLASILNIYLSINQNHHKNLRWHTCDISGPQFWKTVLIQSLQRVQHFPSLMMVFWYTELSSPSPSLKISPILGIEHLVITETETRLVNFDWFVPLYMKVVTLIDIIRPIFNHYIHFLTQNLKSGYLIFEFKIKLVTLGNFSQQGAGVNFQDQTPNLLLVENVHT